MSHSAERCRSCLCGDCLKDYGPDEDCGEPPEDDPRTAVEEVNGETELELMREWS